MLLTPMCREAGEGTVMDDARKTKCGTAATTTPAQTRRTEQFTAPARSTVAAIILAVWMGGLSWVAQAVVGAAPVSESPGVHDWPMFRGNPQLTGVAHGQLPRKLSVRWTFETSEPVTSTAAIVDDTVYVGGGDAFLYALDLASGSLKWKYQAKEAIQSSPAVVDSTVFFGDDDGVFHAVDTRTGKGKWSFQTEAQIISSPNHHAGRVVFGSYDGFVYCLSAREGKLIWKYETEGRIHGTPGIADGLVLVAGCDSHLRVLRLSDGEQSGSVNMNSVSGASAAIRGSQVFVGTYGGHVLGIDWRASRRVWDFTDPERDLPVLSSAAVTEKAVIVGSRDKRLRALNPGTGELLWTFVTKGRIDSSPVVVGRRVFVGSLDGNLYAVDIGTGKELWRFEAGGPISASPAIAAGCLIIGTEDGVIYCLGPG